MFTQTNDKNMDMRVPYFLFFVLFDVDEKIIRKCLGIEQFSLEISKTFGQNNFHLVFSREHVKSVDETCVECFKRRMEK